MARLTLMSRMAQTVLMALMARMVLMSRMAPMAREVRLSRGPPRCPGQLVPDRCEGRCSSPPSWIHHCARAWAEAVNRERPRWTNMSSSRQRRGVGSEGQVDGTER